MCRSMFMMQKGLFTIVCLREAQFTQISANVSQVQRFGPAPNSKNGPRFTTHDLQTWSPVTQQLSQVERFNVAAVVEV